MNKSELQNSTWYDIAIMPTNDNKKVLILLCVNEDRATRLKSILVNNLFELHLNLMPNKYFELVLNFPNEDAHIKFPTKKSAISYPPILHLVKQEIPYITTGVRDSPQMIRWDDNYHPLDRPNMN